MDLTSSDGVTSLSGMNTADYVVALYRGDAFYATRSLSCGTKTFAAAVAQWQRSGYQVVIDKIPRKVKP